MKIATQLMNDDTILYLDGVSVSFDGFKALNELSFYVVAEPRTRQRPLGLIARYSGLS